jgi:membrane protease YdiL (CAAX protease family)
MAQFDPPYTAAPEEAPLRPRKWPLAGVMLIDLVIIFIIVLLATIVVSAVFIGARAVQHGSPIGQAGLSQEQLLQLLGPDGAFAILLIQNGVFLLVPIVRVALIRREPLAEIGFQAPGLPRLIWIGLGLGVATLIINLLTSAAFNAAGFAQNQAEQLTSQFSVVAGDYVGQALFLIGGGLLAPLGEEILFRGYIFNAVRLTFEKRAWGIPLAYLATSFVFAIIHAPEVTQGNAVALLVPLFLVALALAWAMHYTRSLVPCVIAHAINNSIGLIALLMCINAPGSCPNL